MVHLIYKDNKIVGWEMRPITEQEQKIAGTIRDLQFFGTDKTAITYKGLTLLDNSKGKKLGNIKSLKWAKRETTV